jgi:cob(I)alamin adenosyltransferase
MKIYTKGGDKGETQIYAGEMVRLAKNADVVECYGTLDELNAHLGLLHSLGLGKHEGIVVKIQQAIFQIGFAISAETKLKPDDLTLLEKQIDEMQTELPMQTSFILPGGCQAGAQAHICRTVARRAERRLVALMGDYPVPAICIQYINRLSDYLFVLARSLNQLAKATETKV